jgi:hypothetical protein
MGLGMAVLAREGLMRRSPQPRLLRQVTSRGAIHGLQIFGMRQALDILMAIDAGYRRVSRVVIPLLMNKHGNFFSILMPNKAFLPMARKAGLRRAEIFSAQDRSAKRESQKPKPVFHESILF